MSAADKRIAELLERWLTSLELHGGYLDLDNEAYGRAQAWPAHQRPTRWIIDLAKTRTLDLKRMLTERQGRGDTDFADALELMSFLTTLLGSEHVERFVPLAVPQKSGTVVQRMTAPTTRPAAAAAPTPAPATQTAAPAPAKADGGAKTGPKDTTNRAPAPFGTAKTRGDDAEPSTSDSGRTRVIPAARTPAQRVIPAASSRGRSTESTGTRAAARTADTGSARLRTPSGGRSQGSSGQRSTGKSGNARDGATAARATNTRPAPAAESRISERVVKQVIADAVRILDWGSEWPQLAGLIARLADRPSEKEVWRILREHRSMIESQVKAKARAG
jgi:hypothetical protein